MCCLFSRKINPKSDFMCAYLPKSPLVNGNKLINAAIAPKMRTNVLVVIIMILKFLKCLPIIANRHFVRVNKKFVVVCINVT